MYQRWAERHNYKIKIIDFLSDQIAGYKYIIMLIEGLHVFGYLKAEIGIHRIKRISPYGDGSRKHTSFAAVSVSPQVEAYEFKINMDDVKIETFCSGGKGGQHANKSNTAARCTYLPLKITAQSQNERSQHQNIKNALVVLNARVLSKKTEEHELGLKFVVSNKKTIGWGQQIRTYCLAPGDYVKDHRTNYEITNANKVFDGEIQILIDKWLSSISR